MLISGYGQWFSSVVSSVSPVQKHWISLSVSYFLNYHCCHIVHWSMNATLLLWWNTIISPLLLLLDFTLKECQINSFFKQNCKKTDNNHTTTTTIKVRRSGNKGHFSGWTTFFWRINASWWCKADCEIFTFTISTVKLPIGAHEANCWQWTNRCVCVFTKNIPHEGTADEGVKGSWCIGKTMPSFSKCLKMFIRVKNLHYGSRQDDKNTCYVNMHTLLQLPLVNSGKFF